MTTRPCLPALALWVLLGSPAAAQDLLLQARPDEAPLGPMPLTASAQGVTLNLRRTFFFSRIEGVGGPAAHVRLLLDLADVQSQAKLGSLVGSIELPRDECAHDGINLVVGISARTLTIAGREATLRLEGQVDPWYCQPPFGKTRIAQQPVTVTLPFHLRVANEHAIVVTPDSPHVELHGSLAGATDTALHFLNVDLDILVQQAITRSINPDLLQWSLPPELQQAHPTLTGATFLANGDGTLLASVEMTAPLSLDWLLKGQH
jgi:hypothetical protein